MYRDISALHLPSDLQAMTVEVTPSCQLASLAAEDTMSRKPVLWRTLF